MKVLHVITDLNQGGAEAVLYQLIVATQQEVQHCVVSLHGDGVYGERLRKINVDVHVLNMPRGRVKFSGLLRLRRIMLDYDPDVVQTRMYHADLLGGVAAIFAGSLPVVWAVHATELGAIADTWKTRIVRRICAVLSGILPSAIITDAQKSADVHTALGYPIRKTVVIPNGVDLSLFCQDKTERQTVRQELGVEPGQFLIGFVARWHPLKDHVNLLQALAVVKTDKYPFRCVLAGSDMKHDNGALVRLIHDNGLDDYIILLGPRSDVSAIMNAIDLHVLSSCTESLPVAVIEAMSCGTPCVVTDVGDAARIVGDTGWVVAPRSSAALATAIESAIEVLEKTGKDARGQLCRDRIAQNFSLDKMAKEYIRIWKTAITQSSSRSRSTG
ncbi:MAG TPA: glycosyltransferase [Methylobacter sp.]